MSARIRSCLLVGCATVAALALAPSSVSARAQAAPPSNDRIQDAMQLGAFPQDITQSAARATADPTDGPHVGGHSIWFTFTATRSQRLRYTTAGSSFDTLLTLFEGSRNDRVLVDWDDDGGPGVSSAEQSRVVRGTPVLGRGQLRAGARRQGRADPRQQVPADLRGGRGHRHRRHRVRTPRGRRQRHLLDPDHVVAVGRCQRRVGDAVARASPPSTSRTAARPDHHHAEPRPRHRSGLPVR